MANGDDAARLAERVLHEAAGARVIWDFDGVVGHTEPLHEASYRDLAERRNYRFGPGFFGDLVGHTEQWIWERVISEGFPAASCSTRSASRAASSPFAIGTLHRDPYPWITRASRRLRLMSAIVG
jgi:beta-phosphoglucomutase-like phosphatase (HAD superfamily)